MTESVFQIAVNSIEQRVTPQQLTTTLSTLANKDYGYVPSEDECISGLGAILIFCSVKAGEAIFGLINLPPWTQDNSLSKELVALVSLSLGIIKNNTTFCSNIAEEIQQMQGILG